MSSIPMSSTKQRILQTSLALFNQRGERVVTTNHIAAELGISSGNLYYHFKNKQAIIRELFEQYQQDTLSLLALPEDRELTPADKIRYFQVLSQQLWLYRFLHRDVYHLIESIADFQELYPRFACQIMRQGQRIYEKFVAAGLMRMNTAEIEALVVNVWIVLTNWTNFLYMSGHLTAQDESEQWVGQVMRQMLFLEAPYLVGDSRQTYEQLLAQFRAPSLFAEMADPVDADGQTTQSQIVST